MQKRGGESKDVQEGGEKQVCTPVNEKQKECAEKREQVHVTEKMRVNCMRERERTSMYAKKENKCVQENEREREQVRKKERH